MWVYQNNVHRSGDCFTAIIMVDEITSGTRMHTVLGLQVCAGILRGMPQTLPFQQPKFSVLRLQVYASPPGSCNSVAPNWTISLLVVIFFSPAELTIFLGFFGPTPVNNGLWHWLIRHPDPEDWEELRDQSCESQGGCPGLPSLSLIACTVSVDVQQHWTPTGQSSHTHTPTHSGLPPSAQLRTQAVMKRTFPCSRASVRSAIRCCSCGMEHRHVHESVKTSQFSKAFFKKPFSAPACKLSVLKSAHTQTPSNYICWSPLRNLLSILWILTEILSHAHVKG